ncbi:hypothetical protein [Parasporobacterium paucivorans]|nr:hypothetical protein [Parasporobacterium paucivorans]
MTFVISGAVHINAAAGNSREMELQESLDHSITDTLETLFVNKSYEIQDADELMADFCAGFCAGQNSNADITVNLIGANYDEGLVFIEVIADFSYQNNNKGKVRCRKAVLLEEEI